MSPRKSLALLILIVSLALLACNLTAGRSPAPDLTSPANLSPAPVTEPAEGGQGGQTGTIIGRLWHDLCASPGDGTPPPPGAPGSCASSPDGGYLANGQFEEGEPGIAGVLVSLGTGACPSTGLAETTTNADGFYGFSGLQPGTYCASIDPLAEKNTTPEMLLVPGEWTYPGTGQGSATVELAAGEQQTEVNFGWDYQLLPETGKDCTDKAAFVDDVTIPDNTNLDAGQTFVKTWRLRNDGTCIWDSNYALVFVDGNQMDGDSPKSLSGPVEPGSLVDLSVELTAPSEDGIYRGDWELHNERDEPFGIGDQADQPFSVRITVGSGSLLEHLGNPDWRDTFDTAGNWTLFEAEQAKMEHSNKQLVMTALVTSGFDTWTVSWPNIKNFYIETVVKTGGDCEGLDRYGLILRAPDTNHGYLAGFSCNGRYSLREWDGSEFINLIEWTESEDIKAGPNQTNTLGVMMEDGKISIYANGALLEQVSDTTYSEGRFGPFIAATETLNFKAYFQEIAYWLLPD